MPNFIEIGETTFEKSVTNIFTAFNILAPQGDPLGQGSPVWVVGYTKPPLATCKILSRSDDPSPRYLLPNFVDFLASTTRQKDPQKHTGTVNDMSPHYMRRQ